MFTHFNPKFDDQVNQKTEKTYKKVRKLFFFVDERSF